MTASRRRRARAPSTGPSITRRTLRIRPTRRPSASTTSQSRTSLIRVMAAARDVADDVVAGPSFGGEGCDVVGVDGEIDRHADVADPAVRDAARIVERRMLDVGGEPRQPPAGGAAPQSIEQVPWPGEDGSDVPRAVLGRFDLQVVDLAAQLAIARPQLVVEEVQRGVEDPSGHWPALVMIISGMVATETAARMTR